MDIINTSSLKELKLPELTANAFFYGVTNSGKSWKMIAFAQHYHSKGYKIFDLYGGSANEGTFWCLKSEETKLWQDYANKVGKRFSRNGAKEYKVNLLIPHLESKLKEAKKFPELLPRVKTKIFTIPISEIEIEDILYVTGEVSQEGYALWNDIKRFVKDKTSAPELMEWIKNKSKTKRSKKEEGEELETNPFFRNPIYKTFLLPLYEEKLLSSAKCENALTNEVIEEEMKDKETISVLVHDYLPEQFRLFFMGYLARRVFKIALNTSKLRKNIALFREASMFMKVYDKSSRMGEQTQIFRNDLSNIARQSRRGLFLFLDCQSPREVAGLVEGQYELLGISNIPPDSISDREQLIAPLVSKQVISSKNANIIHQLKPEQMVLVLKNRPKAIFIRHAVQPPRCMCYRQTIGLFMEVWESRINSWKITSLLANPIKEEYDNYVLQRKIEKEEINYQDKEEVKKVEEFVEKQVAELPMI